MKKIYDSPIICITVFEENDVITSSGEEINDGNYGLGKWYLDVWETD